MNKSNNRINIAYFISSHGFGHAARATAVMQYLSSSIDVTFDVYTAVPEWFFPLENINYNYLATDTEITQTSPLSEDLVETKRKLDESIPYDEALIIEVAEKIKKSSIVISDISPLGIVAAKKAGVHSVLIENFTWDWLFELYFQKKSSSVKYFEYVNTLVDTHIKTAPYCDDKKYDYIINPISRIPHRKRDVIRDQTGFSKNDTILLISMGGVKGEYPFIEKLLTYPQYKFIVMGVGKKEFQENNILLLPQNHRYYHPDLIEASDAAIYKGGYSTISECYNAGIPSGVIYRELSPESAPLKRFVDNNMSSCTIKNSDWENGNWLKQLPQILNLKRVSVETPNGSIRVSEIIQELTL
ncbi:MAG: hypothetical protein GY714_09480 [Desulfobacterales bacterium]|nr:hypothetical protein [Desulfobacterales bacterium]